MNFKMPSFKNLFWERNKSGQNFYTEMSENEKWGITGSNLEIAQNHPILTPALLFVSKLFSQASFSVKNIKTGELLEEHPLLDILGGPNFFQTKTDLLESLMFMQIANGVGVIWKRTVIGFPNDVESMYLLDYDLIEWPEEFKTPLSALNNNNKLKDTVVRYDKDGENHQIKLSELMFFYDCPNGLKSKNIYKNSSRLDGLRQTLINTVDSLVAKNIILKTNGKEMLSGSKEGFPLDNEEKQDAQRLFNVKYGLSKTRSRSLITKANVTWQSLHIALRDLGLDESVKVDGNIIFTALHIPKDILSLEAKKTTYNNYKESMVSYIQNEQQSSLDYFCEVVNKSIKYKGFKLVGTFDHLPVMQFIKKQKYESAELQGKALKALLDSGVPEEIALVLVDLPKNTKLSKPVVQQTPATNETL